MAEGNDANFALAFGVNKNQNLAINPGQIHPAGLSVTVASDGNFLLGIKNSFRPDKIQILIRQVIDPLFLVSFKHHFVSEYRRTKYAFLKLLTIHFFLKNAEDHPPKTGRHGREKYVAPPHRRRSQAVKPLPILVPVTGDKKTFWARRNDFLEKGAAYMGELQREFCETRASPGAAVRSGTQNYRH